MGDSGMEMEESLRQLALDPAEINKPVPITLWKLAIMIKLIANRSIQSTPTLLKLVCDVLPSSELSEPGSIGVKTKILYGELYLAIWWRLGRSVERLNLAFIEVVLGYLHSICEDSSQDLPSVDVPVTSNPYAASLHQSEDVIRHRINSSYALYFVDLAFQSNLRSSTRELGLHRACDTFINRFSLTGHYAIGAKEAYRALDEELSNKDNNLHPVAANEDPYETSYARAREEARSKEPETEENGEGYWGSSAFEATYGTTEVQLTELTSGLGSQSSDTGAEKETRPADGSERATQGNPIEGEPKSNLKTGQSFWE